MKRKFFLSQICFLLVFVYLFSVSVVFSHNFGSYWEKEVNGYRVDVGYSPDIFMEDTPVRFDFAILDPQTKQDLNFSDVWVRIEQNNRLFFAGGLGKAKFGPTGISYTFLEPNDYTLSARYSNASGTITEAEFDFTILPKNIPFWQVLIPRYWVIIFVAIAVSTSILILISFTLFKKRIKHGNFSKSAQNKLNWSVKNSKKLSILLNILIFIFSIIAVYLLAGFLLDFFKLNELQFIENIFKVLD
jgi:hypothetical protein